AQAGRRDAGAKRWLDRANAPLCKLAAGDGPARQRLEKWLRTAFSIKQKKVCDDPEMFATYLALAQGAREVVEAYKDKQVDLIAKILSDGVAQGVFEMDDVKTTARAVFDATVRYHHPAHAEEWAKPECPSRIDALIALLLRGVRVCKH
ncbi:TetR/AcrR family transcriptional regulator, partial [Bradyrhizobium sp.]|uniref:TetR/AcrR family transcriptional regulator n=1 Tax=Bradyrhizobium sp. TaxID=376 RepID=UPI00391AD282